MKNLKKVLLALSLIAFCQFTASAQGPGFDDDTIDQVPVDGGLSILAIAGIGYGVKKLKDNKQAKNK